MKVFILSTLHTDEWEVNDIVGSKDKLEEK